MISSLADKIDQIPYGFWITAGWSIAQGWKENSVNKQLGGAGESVRRIGLDSKLDEAEPGCNPPEGRFGDSSPPEFESSNPGNDSKILAQPNGRRVVMIINPTSIDDKTAILYVPSSARVTTVDSVPSLELVIPNALSTLDWNPAAL